MSCRRRLTPASRPVGGDRAEATWTWMTPGGTGDATTTADPSVATTMTHADHPRVAELIGQLNLVAHPEGGYYTQIFFDCRRSSRLMAALAAPA